VRVACLECKKIGRGENARGHFGNFFCYNTATTVPGGYDKTWTLHLCCMALEVGNFWEALNAVLVWRGRGIGKGGLPVSARVKSWV